MVSLDRVAVITDKNTFKKEFPDKAGLVIDYSDTEMLTLFFKIRGSVAKGDLILGDSIEAGYEAFNDILSNADYGEIPAIVNGIAMLSKEPDMEMFLNFRKLYNYEYKFFNKLFSLHCYSLKQGIRNRTLGMCSNMLLHCSDEQFLDTINSIDFEFTTLYNVFTATRMPFINSESYGKIMVSGEIHLLNVEETIKRDTLCAIK